MQNNDTLTKYLANRRIENAARFQEIAVHRQQKEIEAQQRKLEEEEKARLQREEQERRRKENANFFERLGHTIADLVGNVGAGLVGGIEGIIDAGAGVQVPPLSPCLNLFDFEYICL